MVSFPYLARHSVPSREGSEEKKMKGATTPDRYSLTLRSVHRGRSYTLIRLPELCYVACWLHYQLGTWDVWLLTIVVLQIYKHTEPSRSLIVS